MTLSVSSRIWDDSASPEIVRLTRRYETDWRGKLGSGRPDLGTYLPADPAIRPPALLALVRLDLALRWEAGERAAPERYLERYPELAGDAPIALLYEEFCLREEAGESPDANEYATRFPALAASFREVLEIHRVVGKAHASLSMGRERGATPLPEAGQTIAGFRLMEELGRGAFARAFLAQERDLADRPVALKVSRTGTREPQTLARLQHTHIVPVYSQRADSASGLQLLCMPYLGRITLTHVLNDPAVRDARSGPDLQAILDRLGNAGDATAGGSGGRSALTFRSYPRAVAWWCARLADALQHAHERGILHGDIKPSNILITGDGLPMLLDFNLARESWFESPEASAASWGGTLAYMAPEQLEALADGRIDRRDVRTEVYALGVVLFECLARAPGTFAPPPRSASLIEATRRAAVMRRAKVPRLRDRHKEVSAALDTVIRGCLAPDPDDRYGSAGQLAADLQAAADDLPLRYAREPLASRFIHGLRRNWKPIAVAVPLFLAFATGLLIWESAGATRHRVEGEIGMGRDAVQDDRLELAVSHFSAAGSLAATQPWLRGLRAQAAREREAAKEIKGVRDRVDRLFAIDDGLRFRLLGFSGDPEIARRTVVSALESYGVLQGQPWPQHPDSRRLDETRRARLLGEGNELLFLSIVAQEREWINAHGRESTPPSEQLREAIRVCDIALAFAAPPGPWKTLRDRETSRLSGAARAREQPADPQRESSARACVQLALIRDLEGDREATIAWLERAIELDPDDYWSQFYLGHFHGRAGHPQRALGNYSVAIALRPRMPWAWYNRALVFAELGDLGHALEDLDRALAIDPGFSEARLNRGVVKMLLGDVDDARAAFDSLIEANREGPMRVAAVLNRAQLDAEAGAFRRALGSYASLLAENPRENSARMSRALLLLRMGRPAEAETDLTILLRDDPERGEEILARRAGARLALRHAAEAEDDAANAYRRNPNASHERLWIRTLLALGQVEDLLWIKQPDDLSLLPEAGPELTADLRRAADRLRSPENTRIPANPLRHRTRAVLLSALGDATADDEATLAIATAPASPEARLVRARVRRRNGDSRRAMDDVEAGLALDPGEPRLLTLRALLETESGHPRRALTDLKHAAIRGAGNRIYLPRALALMADHQPREALESWTLALSDDPENARLYIGRARCLIALGLVDRATVDLERASELSLASPALLARVSLAYAACLPQRPQRFPRWLTHLGRAWYAAFPSASGEGRR